MIHTTPSTSPVWDPYHSKYITSLGSTPLQVHHQSGIHTTPSTSPVWDPHHSKYISRFERTQRFAARIVTGKWLKDATPLLSQFGWPTLTKRPCTSWLCETKALHLQTDPSGPSHQTQFPPLKTLLDPYARTVSSWNKPASPDDP